MASIIKIGQKWRALAAKSGHGRCQTFTTQVAAIACARTVEYEVEELKSTGHMQPRGISLGDLIDRCSREPHPLKLCGRSKTAHLRRIKTGLGHILACTAPLCKVQKRGPFGLIPISRYDPDRGRENHQATS